MNLEDLSLADAASAIRTGAVSPLEYVRALLAQVDRVDPQIQAWVTIDRDAVLSAAKQSEAEARKKQYRGALHGIPVGIKDIFYTKGLRTTMGSVLFKDFIPEEDADAVARLRDAGAIIMGKTVTTLFANLDPGPTRNAVNLNHTPGGSSSGSAAAVAARMCPAAIGTQTVGSVGRPAAFNGVVSMVPTRETASLKGVFPLAWSLDHAGVFGRTVDDVRLLVHALARIQAPTATYTGNIRIGLVRAFFYDHADTETRVSLDACASKLAASGFEVEEVTLPAVFELAQPILRMIVRTEAASIHEDLFRKAPETYGPKLRTLIETGLLMDGVSYLRARRLRRQYQQSMATLFDRFDVLMTPAAPGTAPEGIGSTGDPVMNGPWTLADFPTMTLPYARGKNGLPLGLQISAAPLREEFLLDVAKRIELPGNLERFGNVS
jgi:Asp-tRNA(Asn)/Glu-tRNA(Gln) amidotransferase A subunit family amidase